MVNYVLVRSNQCSNLQGIFTLCDMVLLFTLFDVLGCILQERHKISVVYFVEKLIVCFLVFMTKNYIFFFKLKGLMS